jgi:hypothetical protein
MPPVKAPLARLRNAHGTGVAAETRRLCASVALTDEARTGLARFLGH